VENGLEDMELKIRNRGMDKAERNMMVFSIAFLVLILIFS
jgi:hypothetical protein